MRRLVAIAGILILALLWVQPLLAAEVRPQRLVITHVTIIDTRTGQLLKDRNVVIVADRIVAVEPATSARLQRGDVLVNGRGKYLIPGLWDCHVHLSWTTESALPLLIALGITDVRDVGGKLTELEDWRARIANGSLVGPRIMRVGAPSLRHLGSSGRSLK